jgi:hypothetical protein
MVVHGTRNRKKREGSVLVTGNALEKFPLPSNVPVVFVVHCAKGTATLVEVNQVKLVFGCAPVPVRIRLPPE